MQLQVLAIRSFNLTDDDVQAVGREEMYTFWLAFESTYTNLVYIADTKSVLDGWSQHRAAARAA